MKTFLTLVLAATAVFGLSACMETTDYEQIRSDKIRACIERGGQPEYAVDRFGEVQKYFGCVE